MKKSDYPQLRPLTDAELAQVSEEQKRYIPALSLIPQGTYHFECRGGNGTDKNNVNIYPAPYIGNDGQPRTFQAVCLKETQDLIPISAFVERSISVGGKIITSKGFYPTAENLSDCVAVLNALSTTKKGFVLTHKVGTWADGGRRKGTKPVVTPL